MSPRPGAPRAALRRKAIDLMKKSPSQTPVAERYDAALVGQSRAHHNLGEGCSWHRALRRYG